MGLPDSFEFAIHDYLASERVSEQETVNIKAIAKAKGRVRVHELAS